MYAIIDDGARQYKVSPGDVIHLDRPGADEKTITFDRVLLIAGDGAAKIGQPTVPGATVKADVVGAIKAKKIDTIKYRRRKGYHKKIGHRQNLLAVKITAING
jgi:large subunit ribosomal protein L21